MNSTNDKIKHLTATDDKPLVISIPEIMELIKHQTGLRLELCDYFTGVREHNGREYFNVILSQRTSESKEYDTLKRFADKYKLISVEPNGLKRVSVFTCVQQRI